MATCSFAGLLFGPRVRRSAATVSATPPPGVIAPLFQSTPAAVAVGSPIAAAFAAAISFALKRLKVLVGFLTVGIAARNQMRGLITPRSPNQEDDATLPHAKALQPKLAVAFARIFHRDQRVVETGSSAARSILCFRVFTRRFGSSQVIMRRLYIHCARKSSKTYMQIGSDNYRYETNVNELPPARLHAASTPVCCTQSRRTASGLTTSPTREGRLHRTARDRQLPRSRTRSWFQPLFGYWS